MLTLLDFVLLFGAALLAGATNALAGGGAIFTFPALIAVGVPPLAANITNTVASCPGYVGGVWGQRRDLAGQSRRALWLVPAAVAGGVAGGVLLLQTPAALFEDLVPWLVIAACLLMALQGRIRRLLTERRRLIGMAGALLPVLIAGIYGGYFGAGLSIMFLAVLGLAIDDSLTRLNALKQLLSLAVNVAAALLFAGTAAVIWPAALVMAVGSLAGGVIGGRMASLIDPDRLRMIVIAVGVIVAAATALWL